MQGRHLDPDKLRDLLIDSGLTVDDFADLVGISRSFAYALRAGDRQPSLDVALRMAEVLRCSRRGGVKAFTVKDETARRWIKRRPSGPTAGEEAAHTEMVALGQEIEQIREA